MLKKNELVTSYFGYWPEFSDGKIEKIVFDSGGALELTIHYIDVDQKKAAQVGLRFEAVSDIELTDFRSENVVDRLRIGGDAPHSVSLEPCYGLGGTFVCKGIEVLCLTPDPATPVK
jgi:hypothetical protein